MPNKKQPLYSDIEKMEQSSPYWLSLFHSVKEEAGYSFATDLFVNSPLFYNKKTQPRDEKGRLPVLERSFTRPGGQEVELTILPGQVEKKTGQFKGKWIDCYPGEKEFLLLEVLKKMAMQGRGIVLDDRLAVAFVVSDVIQELKALGKSANHTRIIESLLILNRSTMVFKMAGESKNFWNEPYLLSVGVDGRGKDMRVFVRFNTATSDAIKSGAHRIFAHKILESGNTLAIRLHQHIVFSYRQLDMRKNYVIESLAEFLGNVGYSFSKRPRESAALMDAALDCMVEYGDIRSFERDAIIREGSRTVIDYRYILKPTKRLEREVVKANARQRDRVNALQEDH